MIIDSLLESGKKKGETWNNIISSEELINCQKESNQWHFQKCPLYHLFCKKKQFYPFQDINSLDDFKKIPYITTASFKRYGLHAKDFLGIPEKKIDIWCLSRGSSLDSSMIGRDHVNLQRLYDNFKIIFDKILQLPKIKWILFAVPPIPADLFEAPTPKKVPHFNYFFEDFLSKEYGISLPKFYGIKIVRPDAKYEILKYGVNLESYEQIFTDELLYSEPGLIIGLVPGVFKGITDYRKEKGSIPALNSETMILTYGGWSAPDRTKIEPKFFRDTISSLTGLHTDNIRDIYGFTETDPIFAECKFHNKHVPPWVDVIIRNVESLEPIKPGNKGLINVINPMAYSYAGTSILQDDVVSVESIDECPCGNKGKIIKVYGPALN